MYAFFHRITAFSLKRDCKDTERARNCNSRFIVKRGPGVVFLAFWPKQRILRIPAERHSLWAIYGLAKAAFLLLFAGTAYGQSTNAPLNEEYYHKISRYEIKQGQLYKDIFTQIKPFKRQAIVATLDSVPDETFTSEADKFNYNYLMNDNWEWSRNPDAESKKPFLKELYKKKSDFWHVDTEDFDLHVNPVLYLGVGKDNRLNSTMFINTRGVEIRGMVDKKIGFYTYIGENQARMPLYAKEYGTQYGYNIVPHQGFWKSFKNDGVDFFEARGYIDFNLSKHIWFQFGYDRTFIGNGFRSLIFSDFAPPSQFLRANVKVWKLNYFFQLNRMTADATATPGGSVSSQRYPDKYMAFHHLSINVSKKLNLGVFESVMFSPQDTVNGGTFELNYLNPVIFYRAIEQQNGSADNVILGLDWKWLALKKVSFYGQLVLDEFVLDNITSGNGWWANKYALQAGVTYVDAFGVDNLDIQLETNIARPYTYSHKNRFTNYAHYLQPIAHPLGANFSEVATVIRYQPMPRLQFTFKGSYIKTGRDNTVGDPAYVDWGGDIIKSYYDRMQEYDNKIGQGYDNKILYVDLLASYMLKHNFFIDLHQTFRNSESPYAAFNNNTSASSIAIRWNIAPRTYDF